MSGELAIAVNSRVRDILRLHEFEDQGAFSKAFSQEVAERLSRGEKPSTAVEGALRLKGKTFSMLNRGRVDLFKR